MTDYPELPTFRHEVPLEQLEAPVEVRLEAGEADLTRLADFLDIPGVEHVSGTAKFTKSGPLVRVTGDLRAELIRQCVASLEDMKESIEETYSVDYSEDAPEPGFNDEVEVDLDAPEPIENGRLEAGEVLIEQLVLAMTPHPRKEDAEAIEDPGAGARITPFDVLANLKKDS